MAFLSVLHDVILPDDVVEGLRAVFPGEDLIAHAAEGEGGAAGRKVWNRGGGVIWGSGAFAGISFFGGRGRWSRSPAVKMRVQRVVVAFACLWMMACRTSKSTPPESGGAFRGIEAGELVGIWVCTFREGAGNLESGHFTWDFREDRTLVQRYPAGKANQNHTFGWAIGTYEGRESLLMLDVSPGKGGIDTDFEGSMIRLEGDELTVWLPGRTREGRLDYPGQLLQRFRRDRTAARSRRSVRLQVLRDHAWLPSMIPDAAEKRARYAAARERLHALWAGEPDAIARMAGAACILHEAMPHAFWTGFYRVVGGGLVIGPYQGTPGCSRIAWGKGVCGTAWASGETQVVPDVHAFPGHIACDGRAESEIVVPVKNGRGTVVAVFDVDSAEKEAFDEVDREELEAIFAGWG